MMFRLIFAQSYASLSPTRDVEIIIRPKAEGHASGVVSVSVA
jgi:hypothetical protein